MALNSFFNWFSGLFGKKKKIRLGIYGTINVAKTPLANRISKDWTGEEMGKVSEIPHETRTVQKKEKIESSLSRKKIILNLLDMPGIATKIDYKSFLKFGLSKKEARQ